MTFPISQVPVFQVYFIYFQIFEVEYINIPVYQILSDDFQILGIKCLYFPPKTVRKALVGSNFLGQGRTWGQMTSGEDRAENFDQGRTLFTMDVN